MFSSTLMWWYILIDSATKLVRFSHIYKGNAGILSAIFQNPKLKCLFIEPNRAVWSAYSVGVKTTRTCDYARMQGNMVGHIPRTVLL